MSSRTSFSAWDFQLAFPFKKPFSLYFRPPFLISRAGEMDVVLAFPSWSDAIRASLKAAVTSTR